MHQRNILMNKYLETLKDTCDNYFIEKENVGSPLV
jgi:hypothetical protein